MRAFRFSLVLLVAIATVVGCKSKEEESDPNTITLYSGRSEKLVAPLIEKFEEETGITVKVKYGKSGEIAATLLEEGENSPADVFWAQDTSTLGLIASEGMLQELPEDITSAVDARFRSKDGEWIGVSGRARVLSYSTSLSESELPKSIDDLTDPKWKGRIGWAPENASFQAFVTAMVQERGETKTRAWLEAIQANEPKTYPKNTPAVEAVGSGEVDVALVNHYYLYRLKAEKGDDFPVANHYITSGDTGGLINVASVGILETSSKTEAAQKFVAFLLSEEAQKYFATETYEFPLIDGVKPYKGLPTLSKLNPPALDLTKITDLETTVKLLREVDALP